GRIPKVVTAEFGYETDGDDRPLPATLVPCDATSVRGDPADDWAIVHVATALPASIPVLRLEDHDLPMPNAPAFVIQPPGGERKRLAYVRNQITDCNDRVVHYLADTQSGSSGAPVFNGLGRIVALHHMGGRPQEVAGKPPVVKNEGIRIERVLAGLGRAR